MTTTVGLSTSYPITIPDLSETADIQVALELISYGIGSDPISDAAIASNSIFGKIASLNTSKANLASPTFTGTVTLPTGTSSAAPLKLVAGTNLTTPAYGSLEATTDAIFATSNPGSTSTGPGRGIISNKQMVFMPTTGTAAVGTTVTSVFPGSVDTLSVLEAAKLYKFKGVYHFSMAYTSGSPELQLLMTFSNAPSLIRYTFKTMKAGTSTFDFVGSSTVTTATTVSSAISSSVTYSVEFEGFVQTNASLTSTFTPQFKFSTSGVLAPAIFGSYIEIEKVAASGTALIAGNWA